MTFSKLSPSIFAGLQSLADGDKSGPRTAMSPAVMATVDFVERKGPVSERDVAMRFGLTLAGARKCLRAAGSRIVETPDGWGVAA